MSGAGLISDYVRSLAREAEAGLRERFDEIDKTSAVCTERVLDAFRARRVSDSMFAGSSGYGYNDAGREALDLCLADAMGAEAALVRLSIVSGTHAISLALSAACEPSGVLLSVTGEPYDTLRPVIGLGAGECRGSLISGGVEYRQLELAEDGGADLAAIESAASDRRVCCVFIQRSRGYSSRRALHVAEIGEIVACVRRVNPGARVVVDNCYGEFVEQTEPTMAGADLVAGSLIKNPGGGIAPGGGYVAGRAELVERAACRLTAPGIGAECGPTLGQSRLLLQGLFLAPHTVAQALKTAVLAAAMLERLGYDSSPPALAPRADIIQRVELKSKEALARFCRGIQRGSPIDSFVRPEPFKMPGYDCEVIMAAGAFVQGSSIEISADGPMREPFAAYLQGGLSLESGRLCVMTAISEMLDGQ